MKLGRNDSTDDAYTALSLTDTGVLLDTTCSVSTNVLLDNLLLRILDTDVCIELQCVLEDICDSVTCDDESCIYDTTDVVFSENGFEITFSWADGAILLVPVDEARFVPITGTDVKTIVGILDGIDRVLSVFWDGSTTLSDDIVGDKTDNISVEWESEAKTFDTEFTVLASDSVDDTGALKVSRAVEIAMTDVAVAIKTDDFLVDDNWDNETLTVEFTDITSDNVSSAAMFLTDLLI